MKRTVSSARLRVAGLCAHPKDFTVTVLGQGHILKGPLKHLSDGNAPQPSEMPVLSLGT